MSLYFGSTLVKSNLGGSTCKINFYKFVPCLTFSSPNTFSVSAANKAWNGTMEYSLDRRNWVTWDGSEISGTIICFRGNNNTIVSNSYSWKLTGTDIACAGNIETLLDYATVKAGEHPTMANKCYASMFKGCTGLTQAPALPATTLADYCYNGMFKGCTGLTQAPALPATTLAEWCYGGMFSGCTGLTQAPALPSKSARVGCYYNMFKGCTGLTQAPALPSTWTDSNCYASMFYGCTGLTQAPALPALTAHNSCYNSMFYGCTGLTQAPALPAYTVESSAYNRMFYGCTGLKLSAVQTEEYTRPYRIPTRRDGTASIWALEHMFENTGGTFTDTPEINTTYYLHSSNTIV